MPSDTPPQTPSRRRRLLRALGPGIITGAADDDPAGIATYSIAGAQFGTALLWLAPLTWPLMSAVQVMCARIGMVTGGGLMDALRLKLPRPVLALVALALFGANTFNVGADLMGMADAAALLTHTDARLWVLGFGVGIASASMALRYTTIARVLRVLVLALLAYVATALLVGPEWRVVLRDVLIPRLPEGRDAWATVVAILGTTISPYLFFWQASEEVEEEKMLGRRDRRARVGASPEELRGRAIDVGVGALFATVIFFFITLTTALTLHRHGITRPETTTEVAAAQRPLAGPHAMALYAMGLVGSGLLAIPTLAGSAAYAVSELLGWREGLDEYPAGAPGFFAVFSLSVVTAMAMQLTRVSAVRALYWSAILNGLLAPFLLAALLAVASDRKLMAGQPSSRLGRLVVLATTVAMFGAGAALLLTGTAAW